MSGRALMLQVRYVRDGSFEGNLFVGRAGAELELTTPSYLVRMDSEQALELWMELARLFGFNA